MNKTRKDAHCVKSLLNGMGKTALVAAIILELNLDELRLGID
jgi:hypothetical protein